MYDNIRQQDPAVYDAMMRELQRQRDHIELIASENFVSPAVMEAMGSHLTNASMSMRSRTLRATGQCSSSARSTRTSSRTPVHRRMLRCISLSSSRVIPSSAWI